MIRKCDLILRDKIADLVEFKFKENKASVLHDKIEKYLVDNGYYCEREFKTQDRGDGRPGRIDLLVKKDGAIVAIEIDWKTPRKKSLFKIDNLNYVGLIILREGEQERKNIGSTLIISAR